MLMRERSLPPFHLWILYELLQINVEEADTEAPSTSSKSRTRSKRPTSTNIVISEVPFQTSKVSGLPSLDLFLGVKTLQPTQLACCMVFSPPGASFGFIAFLSSNGEKILSLQQLLGLTIVR